MEWSRGRRRGVESRGGWSRGEERRGEERRGEERREWGLPITGPVMERVHE